MPKMSYEDYLNTPEPDPVSTSLPWVGAGLKGVGLLSDLYGNYQKSQQADQNYELQKKEFERQKMIEDMDRENALKQQALKNQYGAADYATGQQDHLLSQYAPYFRRAGLI